MQDFRYIVRDHKGNKKVGLIQAVDQVQASRILHDRGFFVIKLEDKEEELGFGNILERIRGVSITELSNFTRQLSTMISSGLTLSDALSLLSKQPFTTKFKKILNEIVSDIQGGATFTIALSKHQETFPPLFINLVKAGEASGSLDKSLDKLADALEKQREFESQIKGAMLYPMIVVGVMVVVGIIVLLFVIPRVLLLFEEFPDVGLPLPTRVLIFFGSLVGGRGIIILPIIFGAFFMLFRFLKTPKGKELYDRFILRVPILGDLNKNKSLAYTTRTLSVLTASGVPIMESLKVAADVATNGLHRDGLLKASTMVEKGMPLSSPLSVDKNFPPIVPQMIQVGEETGKVDEVLGRLSDYFEFQVAESVKRLSTAIEPMLLIIVGIMVAFMVFAIISPIFKLTGAL